MNLISAKKLILTTLSVNILFTCLTVYAGVQNQCAGLFDNLNTISAQTHVESGSVNTGPSVRSFLNSIGPNGPWVRELLRNDERAYVIGRYGDQWGPNFYNGLKETRLDFLELQTDPGLAVRYVEFLKFYKAYESEFAHLSPKAIRSKFAESLGYKIYYRGLALDETEYNNIKAYGMAHNHLQDALNTGNPISDQIIYNQYGQQSVRTSQTPWPYRFEAHRRLGTELFNRLIGAAHETNMLPITTIPEVAEGVTTHMKKVLEKGDEDQRKYWKKTGPRKDLAVYIFTLRLPVIDVLEPDIFLPLQGKDVTEDMKRRAMSVVIKNKSGDALSFYSLDHHVESEILFGIGAEEIIESKKIDAPQFEYVPK